MSKQLNTLKLLDSAVRWWASHRPVDWDQSQHLANPTINCSGVVDKLLAKNVAAHVAADGVEP